MTALQEQYLAVIRKITASGVPTWVLRAIRDANDLWEHLSSDEQEECIGQLKTESERN